MIPEELFGIIVTESCMLLFQSRWDQLLGCTEILWRPYKSRILDVSNLADKLETSERMCNNLHSNLNTWFKPSLFKMHERVCPVQHIGDDRFSPSF